MTTRGVRAALDHVWVIQTCVIWLLLFTVSEMKELSGNGVAGYKDGDLGSAMFNKPKSFALDRKNNIYIADKTNHVIKKFNQIRYTWDWQHTYRVPLSLFSWYFCQCNHFISQTGMTTIAAGYVQKTGKNRWTCTEGIILWWFWIGFWSSKMCSIDLWSW